MTQATFADLLVPPRGETLASARASFESDLARGQAPECPCCRRRSKVYKRALNAGMVRTLVLIYGHTLKAKPPDGWIQISATFDRGVLRNREYHRLRHWGLLEPHVDSERTAEANSKDLWRITERGRSFVTGARTRQCSPSPGEPHRGETPRRCRRGLPSQGA